MLLFLFHGLFLGLRDAQHCTGINRCSLGFPIETSAAPSAQRSFTRVSIYTTILPISDTEQANQGRMHKCKKGD